MATHFKVVEIKSLKEFLAIVFELPKDGLTLFRGQCVDRPLVPKLGRFGSKDVLRVEKSMTEEFKRKSIPYLTFIPDVEWDWLAIAQHHGMATRLLDWTENPLVALWFSLPILLDSPSDEHSVVWMFQTPEGDIVNVSKEIDPYSGGRTKVFRPKHITRRLTAQNGWFTVHKVSDKGFIPFEKNIQYSKLLTKVIIDNTAIKEIKIELDRLGVNSASLFPDLDGLAKQIEWRNFLY